METARGGRSWDHCQLLKCGAKGQRCGLFCPRFLGGCHLSAPDRQGFLWRVKPLAKPSFSQNSCSSNLQEKEEGRIPPILFWADYFPFEINELPTVRPSCFAQITKLDFCFTRSRSNWRGSLPLRDRVLPMAERKECSCLMEIKVRPKFLSKFICPLLTGEFTVKRLIVSQGFSHGVYSLCVFQGWPSVSEYKLKMVKSGDPGPGIRHHPGSHRTLTSQEEPHPCGAASRSLTVKDSQLFTSSNWQKNIQRESPWYKSFYRPPASWASLKSGDFKGRATSYSCARTETTALGESEDGAICLLRLTFNVNTQTIGTRMALASWEKKGDGERLLLAHLQGSPDLGWRAGVCQEGSERGE